LPSKIFSLLEVFKTKADIHQFVLFQKALHKSLGLVPTMGALHNGHLSLLKESKKLNSITIASIFVNPTQFNNPNDLLNYPRTIESDILQLENAGCDALFLPDENEMYGENENWDYNIGGIDDDLEGANRPGHFKGVSQIVYKLLNCIPADSAFFGQKDFQQFLVIKKMVSDFNMPIQLYSCPIVREKDGLALSSRNIHLSEKERQNALVLFNTLNFIKENFKSLDYNTLIEEAESKISETKGVKFAYLAIRDRDTLSLLKPNQFKNTIALVAAIVGNTRLIDNMMLD
jgi:pantoate--beta-alanine ligase